MFDADSTSGAGHEHFSHPTASPAANPAASPDASPVDRLDASVEVNLSHLFGRLLFHASQVFGCEISSLLAEDGLQCVEYRLFACEKSLPALNF